MATELPYWPEIKEIYAMYSSKDSMVRAGLLYRQLQDYRQGMLVKGTTHESNGFLLDSISDIGNFSNYNASVCITDWFDPLPLQKDLLVRNQLHLCLQYRLPGTP